MGKLMQCSQRKCKHMEPVLRLKSSKPMIGLVIYRLETKWWDLFIAFLVIYTGKQMQTDINNEYQRKCT